MSHISTYAHSITKVNLFCQLARDAGYSVIEEGVDVSLFGSNTVKDAVASILIDGWKYRIAIDQKGNILYDHWGSGSGTMEKLHKLMQTYNEEAILQDIPLDIVNNFFAADLENGDRKLTLEYGT